MTQLSPACSESELAATAQPIVARVVRKLQRELGYQVDASDLASIANEALVALVRRYDPAIAPFAPYLARNLRWMVLDQLRRRKNRAILRGRVRALKALDLVRDTTSPKPIARAPLDEQRAKAKLQEELRLRATAMALPLIFSAYEKARLAPQASPEEKYQRQRTSARVRRVIDDLVDPTEKAVLVRHYFGEESFVKIADALGLSKWQACRLHKRALERVAAALHQ